VGLQAHERLEREGAVISPIAGIVHGSLGRTCYEWNHLEKARNYLFRAIQLSNLSGHNAVVVYSKTILARVFQAQGDHKAAAQTIQEAADRLPLGIPAWLKPEVAAHLVRLYLNEGNSISAEIVLKQLGVSIPKKLDLVDLSDLPHPLTHQDGLKVILSLRFFLHQVRKGQRLEELQPGIDLAGHQAAKALSVQRIEIALQALLLRAQIAAIEGDMEASLTDLRQAVELAEPEGYIRIFLDEEPAIAGLVMLSLKQPVQPGERQGRFMRQLLASSTAAGPAASPRETPTRPVVMGLEDKLFEPLTDREKDVLRLMAEGLKYQEIAGRLFITLNTVRFYVKEIYSKLNVNNRTQAIEAAHKHNLL
jgi:LuxR family maltose regulon positive regulatory protein